MFLELLASMLLGIAFGTATGLIPGIHPNTVFLVMVSGALGIAGLFPVEVSLVFIISLAVSNTFTDFIPSIIFGAPDPSSALSVLPGHRMLSEGRGHEAIMLTVIGGLSVGMLTTLTLPVIIYVIPWAYSQISPHLHWLLMIVVAWTGLSEGGWGRPISFLVFLLSGSLGVVSLNLFPPNLLLFPSLTGLFAVPVLLTSYSSGSVLPEQDLKPREVSDNRKGIFAGWISGWLAGMLPGVGASQAGAVVSQVLKTRTSQFLIALGGINTSNILFTFVMLVVLGKTRSGASWALSQFSFIFTPYIIAAVAVAGLTVCFISTLVTLKISRMFLSRITRIDYRMVNLLVLLFITILAIWFGGVFGLVALASGTLIGLFSIRTGIKRSQMMGFLILPTILHFSGLQALVMVTLV